MSTTKFILISGKAQNGKDTSAEIFYNELTNNGHKVLITHYADLLKWMCQSYFNWNGSKDEAGRSLLQRVGTDVIRAKDPYFWVNWVINLIKLFPNDWDYVIIPDCRFPNEIEAVKNNFKNTKHIRVIRQNFVSPLTAEQQNHKSEIALDDYPYDILLENIDIDDLKLKIKDIVNNM